MQKTYTFAFETSPKNSKSPKQEVLNNILAFSKSLEVLKPNAPRHGGGKTRNVEIVLN
jgi:hypothetical protein